LGNKLTKVR